MQPCLISALRASDKDHFRALLQEDPNQLYAKTVKWNSVLHIAASVGNFSFLTKEMLDRINIDLMLHKNANGDTVLHCAAREGQCDIILRLIGKGVGSMMMSMLNERGDTPLHESARGGHANDVSSLVAGAEDMVGMLNKDGESPLYLATEKGSVEAVRTLLACPMVGYGGPRGQTALHAAVFRSYEIAGMLLQKKPALNHQVDASQSAPIHFAASLGDVNMVNLLLQKDVSVAHLLDSHGLSALHIAASKNYVDVVKEILHHCPDATELTDIEGSNFLHVAAKNRAATVVKLVLSNPLLRHCINELDQEGNTPLHLAVMNHNWEIIQLLLSDRRFNTNVTNRKGLTPLDVASSCANSNIPLRMNKISKELISVGSMHGPHRMDIEMGKDRSRTPDKELNRYRTLANNMAIVAVLIATITFAAAFTLPGGYYNDGSNKEEGMAILAKKLAFKIFLISDTIAMLTSICVTCLLICTGSKDHDIRVHSIITAMKFMWVALGGMVVAFSAGIYVVVALKCRWLAIFIFGMAACVPFIAWMIACWPTLGSIDLVQSIRRQKCIKRKFSIFEVDLLMPHCMEVDFITPPSSAKS